MTHARCQATHAVNAGGCCGPCRRIFQAEYRPRCLSSEVDLVCDPVSDRLAWSKWLDGHGFEKEHGSDKTLTKGQDDINGVPPPSRRKKDPITQPCLGENTKPLHAKTRKSSSGTTISSQSTADLGGSLVNKFARKGSRHNQSWSRLPSNSQSNQAR